jgi:hypothetical protein
MQETLKLLKNLPAIDMAKAAINRNQARVIGLLQWNMAAYSNFMYNSGLQYLDKYTGKDDRAIGKLTPREEFWNWWKILWNARDEAFIDEYDGLEDHFTTDQLRKSYEFIHNTSVLAADTAIPSTVYPKDFSIIKTQMA